MKLPIAKTIIGIAALLSFTACDTTKKMSQQESKPTAINTKKNKDCPDDLMCTMDYRMITVKIIDSKPNNQSALDEVRIFLTDNPRVNLKTFSSEELQSSMMDGVYIIAEDGNMSQLAKAGSKITLVGNKDGIEKVKEHFVIGHDCCHVVLISGPKEIRY